VPVIISKGNHFSLGNEFACVKTTMPAPAIPPRGRNGVTIGSAEFIAPVGCTIGDCTAGSPSTGRMEGLGRTAAASGRTTVLTACWGEKRLGRDTEACVAPAIAARPARRIGDATADTGPGPMEDTVGSRGVVESVPTTGLTSDSASDGINRRAGMTSD
jgi:hypothetical protein